MFDPITIGWFALGSVSTVGIYGLGKRFGLWSNSSSTITTETETSQAGSTGNSVIASSTGVVARTQVNQWISQK